MLEIFELVLNETLVGRNNLVNIKVNDIGCGYFSDDKDIDVIFYMTFIDRDTFWYDCKVIGDIFEFMCVGLDLDKTYVIRSRYIFDGGINS